MTLVVKTVGVKLSGIYASDGCFEGQRRGRSKERIGLVAPKMGTLLEQLFEEHMELRSQKEHFRGIVEGKN